jgi:hypothetical protein
MQAKTGRQANKIVPLPLEGEGALEPEAGYLPQQEVTRPIHVHCTADAFNLKKLANLLRAEYPSAEVHSISECVHCSVGFTHSGRNSDLPADPGDGFAEMFFFEVRLSCGCVLSELYMHQSNRFDQRRRTVYSRPAPRAADGVRKHEVLPSWQRSD